MESRSLRRRCVFSRESAHCDGRAKKQSRFSRSVDLRIAVPLARETLDGLAIAAIQDAVAMSAGVMRAVVMRDAAKVAGLMAVVVAEETTSAAADSARVRGATLDEPVVSPDRRLD